MANPVWQGRALAVPQIDTLTVGGTIADGDTVSVTINRKTATATADSVDTTLTLAGKLYAAIQALITGGTAPEFSEVTWTDPRIAPTDSIDARSASAGNPFTLTVDDSGTTTLSLTPVQAPTGPNDLANPANWSGNALPVAGDNPTIPPNSPPILHNLDALNAVALGTLTILGGTLGYEDRTGSNPNDPNAYYQYRQRHLELLSATAILIGDGDDAPDFCRLKIVGSTSTPIRVRDGSATSRRHAIQLSATAGTDHDLTITGRSVALAPTLGETIDVGTLRIGTDGPTGSFGAAGTDPSVTIGEGVTSMTAARLYGGTVVSNAPFTALVILNGTWRQDRGTPGTVDITNAAGTYEYAGTAAHGVITAAGSGSVVDFTADSQPFTLAAGSSFLEGAALFNPQRCNCTSITVDKDSIAASRLGDTLTLPLVAA
ncbi:MAG: hypothetical protein U0798_15080 [Gemmataceae bacterium]